MAQTQAEIVAAFDSEVGDGSTVADTTEKTRWFNDGQSRLEWYRPMSTTLSWADAATSVALPADFVSLDRIVPNTGTVLPAFKVFGANLQCGARDAASGAGGASLQYWADWPVMSVSQASLIPRAGDVACILYAISRFYRKLASSRSLYERYSTILGANAVGIADLTQIADDYFNEFLLAKNDLPARSLILDGPRSTAYGDRTGAVARESA